MSRDEYGIEIFKSVAYEGVGQWATMAGDMERTVESLAAEVRACLAAAPWGDGLEGKAFWQKHCADGGPHELVKRFADLPNQLRDAGDRARQVVDNLRTTDAGMGQEMRAGAQIKEV
ncbi:hypothetical protein ACIBEJ_21050 [Nonomuraea sp. NPDC050790]|uniref:hypothetical protein n=1 Tax=Nonomuraea sp. NPDC050790 TaxID=3364371 RepID=UPI00378B195A